MKRRLMNILLALVLVLLFAGTALAQDATSEPAATQDATAVATEAATGTDTPTDTSTEGETGNAGTSTGMNPDMVFVGIVLLSLVFGLADKFTNYRLSKELAAAVPADWKPVVEQGANTARRIIYERAGAFADSTESPIDNNLLDEDMKRAGWEFYTDAATGERHARKVSPPVAAQSASAG